MSQALFSSPPGDGEEPDGFPLPSAAEGDWEDWDGPAEQGLYMCLPPEQLTLAGFAQGGEADTMTPGPLLAAVVDTVAGRDGSGLAGCSDEQLMGIISAGRRMAARGEWTSMAAIAEYAARHAGSRPADEFAPVELGFELHLTPQSAAERMQFSSAVAARLPATFAALGAGQIHPVHVRIIEDETCLLSAEDAARADEILAGQAPGMTYGELRYAAHKLVLKLDPEAARKRKEAARRKRTCAGSGSTPATPAWWPASCRRMRCWPRGSTSSSAPWTCAQPACRAPCRSCACGPTSTCCKNAIAATSLPSPMAPAPPASLPRTPTPRTATARTVTRLATDPAERARAVPVLRPALALAPGRASRRW
jgi:Domain of unknown function (DUF222)